MLELLKKSVLTGVGLALLTKDKLDSLAGELIRQGEISEKEGAEFVEEFLRKSQDAQKELEQQVEKIVTGVAQRLQLATRQDIAELAAKIDALASTPR